MSAVTAPERLPLAEAMYRELRTAILSCRLTPGASIDAAEIALRTGISKTPVREALQRLAIDDLVEVLPRRGYRVKPVTFRAVSELLDLRLALGPHAARTAAALASPADIAMLRRLIGEAGAGDGTAVRRRARRFHIAIARLSGNRRLAHLTEQLFDEFDRVIRLTVDFRVRANANITEFEELVAAIEAGDGDRAAALEAEHIAESRRFLLTQLIEGGFLSNAEIAIDDGEHPDG